MTRKVGKKVCGRCGKTKALARFHWLKGAGSYHSYCKPCLASYMRSRARRKAKETKVCGRCGCKKQVGEFYKAGRQLHSYCKPCYLDYYRRRRVAAKRRASRK